MALELAIIDGGGSNIASLRFALERLGVQSELTSDAEAIRTARRVILPGVGAAADGMQRLRAAGLDQLIPQLKQPLLGVCLGMQLLFEASEEDDADCLGIFPGTARRFTPAEDRPVPHMGWNRLKRTSESSLLDGIEDGTHVYFVHSFALPVNEVTAATSDYGQEFAAVAERDNFAAAQFHPERSGAAGARLIENFLKRT